MPLQNFINIHYEYMTACISVWPAREIMNMETHLSEEYIKARVAARPPESVERCGRNCCASFVVVFR